MFCSNCGNEIEDGNLFCQSCGASVGAEKFGGESQNSNMGYQQNNMNQNAGYQQSNMNQNMGYQQNSVDLRYMAPTSGAPVNPNMDYTPISMWGYFGYELLFCIPLVGFILLLVFSFGGTRNINLRNFARSYFCLLIIAVIIAVIVFAILAGSGAHYMRRWF